jgi:hypothetical protein
VSFLLPSFLWASKRLNPPGADLNDGAAVGPKGEAQGSASLRGVPRRTRRFQIRMRADAHMKSDEREAMQMREGSRKEMGWRAEPEMINPRRTS